MGIKITGVPGAKKTTGIYHLLEFQAPTDFNEKLKIQLLRDEQVLRHMTTKLDKHAVEYNLRKKNGITLKESNERLNAEVKNG